MDPSLKTHPCFSIHASASHPPFETPPSHLVGTRPSVPFARRNPATNSNCFGWSGGRRNLVRHAFCQRHSNKPRDTWGQCRNSVVHLVCGGNEFQFTRHLCDAELASTLIMGRGDLEECIDGESYGTWTVELMRGASFRRTVRNRHCGTGPPQAQFLR